MILKLLGSQREEFNGGGLVITAYRIIDDKGYLVTHATSRHQAEERLARWKKQYPERRFYIAEDGGLSCND